MTSGADELHRTSSAERGLPRDLRGALVDVLAHELRTPLTAIYGGSHLLRVGRLPAATRAALVDDIAVEAERLYGVVEDVLAVERVATGTLDVAEEPILMQRLIADAARAEERRGLGRRVVVEVDGDLPPVLADESAMAHVLRDLLGEAARADAPDEPIVVRATWSGGEILVAVRGPGAHAKATGGSETSTDTGLRLIVARLLIEAQGGRLWLRPRRSGGLEVGVALPADRGDPADPADVP